MSLVEVAERAQAELDKRRLNRRYRDDPVLWAETYLGVQLWSAQKAILESVRDNRNTAVAAAHGVGKTWVTAVAVAWWVDVHPPEETFVASTAPTIDQVRLLWDNLRRVHAVAKKRYDEGLVDHPLPGYIVGSHNAWKLDDGTLLGQGRRPSDEESGFQGRHAPYLLAIADEAVAVPGPLLEALGNIATGVHNRQLLLANPTDPNCAMAKLWGDHITTWNRMHISLMDSPTITNEPGFDLDKASGMSGWNYINEKREEWGEDDPRYIARVLGQWAFDAGNTVYTAEEIASARNTVVVPHDYSSLESGWDIARMGSDFTVGYLRQRGEVWTVDPETGQLIKGTGVEGTRIRRIDKWSKAPLTGNNPANPGSAQRIDSSTVETGVSVVKVDASGIGSGVIDGLAEIEGPYLVIEVFGGAPASDKRAYTNMRAEQFFALKAEMNKKTLDLDPDDQELLDELSGIQFEHTDRGPIKIESKEQMRKKGNKKSPDHADACWYAYLDVDHLFEPVNQMTPGQQAIIDPADLLEFDYAYGSAGVPM